LQKLNLMIYYFTMAEISVNNTKFLIIGNKFKVTIINPDPIKQIIEQYFETHKDKMVIMKRDNSCVLLEKGCIADDKIVTTEVNTGKKPYVQMGINHILAFPSAIKVILDDIVSERHQNLCGNSDQK
jgi:hypothetical protein